MSQKHEGEEQIAKCEIYLGTLLDEIKRERPKAGPIIEALDSVIGHLSVGPSRRLPSPALIRIEGTTSDDRLPAKERSLRWWLRGGSHLTSVIVA